MQPKLPKGIKIFSALIIVSSLIQINTLILEKDWYFELYDYMPKYLALIRYMFSWTQRIVGISIAAGLLFYKDIFRKTGILLGFFTMCTVYWKHPYMAFSAHAQKLDEILAGSGFASLPLKASDLTVLSIIIHSALDIAFWGIFIYYFTRPNIKKLFVHDKTF